MTYTGIKVRAPDVHLIVLRQLPVQLDSGAMQCKSFAQKRSTRSSCRTESDTVGLPPLLVVYVGKGRNGLHDLSECREVVGDRPGCGLISP
ncbi:hypothetical protein PoB_007650800 [Plakobranchus ocellatus]|uniref:Uncharacterized protein n=1 Tax=Plakobranchus ocellatus TaxID=259542 RepID=A0AAV4E0X3_9GAST|nr:hypothetical protein PoB_007650800 [Plakobranchus ocellatus]